MTSEVFTEFINGNSQHIGRTYNARIGADRPIGRGLAVRCAWTTYGAYFQAIYGPLTSGMSNNSARAD